MKGYEPPIPGPSDPLSDDQMIKLLGDLDQLEDLAKAGGASAFEAWSMGLRTVARAEYWRKLDGMASNEELRKRVQA